MITLKPSRVLVVFFLSLSFVSIFALMLSGLSVFIKIILSVFCLIYTLYLIKRFALLCSSQSILSISKKATSWQLINALGETVDDELLSRFVLVRVAILRFKQAGSVLILQSSVSQFFVK
jgi:hypothetical protein